MISRLAHNQELWQIWALLLQPIYKSWGNVGSNPTAAMETVRYSSADRTPLLNPAVIEGRGNVLRVAKNLNDLSRRSIFNWTASIMVCGIVIRCFRASSNLVCPTNLRR